MKESERPQNWQDLAIALFDRLTGRDAEITYEAKELVIHVPEKVGEGATLTPWKVNGTLKIHTDGTR